MGELFAQASLEDVLAARDRRREIQLQLLGTWNRPIVCLTLNIPGPEKRTGLTEFLFERTTETLFARLGPPIAEEYEKGPGGSAGFFVWNQNSEPLKNLCVELETASPEGRLLDLDVITPSGEKISRKSPRRCLLCENAASVCARSRAHGLQALQWQTNHLLASAAAEEVAAWAVGALLEEANLTPKPGLVDRSTCGAHQDMDLPLLETSARSLLPWFKTAFCMGAEAQDCMSALQAEGRRAEARMLERTGGVNTHKGALYLMGLAVAALGACMARGEDLFAAVARLAKSGAPSSSKTHGAAVRVALGASGARGEAEAGIPHGRLAWRCLRAGESGSRVLMRLILACDDTNLLYRGGQAGLAFARQWAQKVLSRPPEQFMAALKEMDRAMVARNLSPGGCADLLAVGIFLRKSERWWSGRTSAQ